MNNPFQQHGAFSWGELITTDASAARTFYGELFNWEMKEGPVAGIDYTVVSAGGEQIGGIMERTKEMGNMPPCWGSYVTVDDVEETVKKAIELGGKICIPPKEIPDVGQFAMIQDPQGAVLYVITYQPMTSVA